MSTFAILEGFSPIFDFKVKIHSQQIKDAIVVLKVYAIMMRFYANFNNYGVHKSSKFESFAQILE